MKRKTTRKQALDYHAKPSPGKIKVVPTKKYATQRDLSLAYSPGVAEPCLEIENDKSNSYKYTSKGNLSCCYHKWDSSFRIGKYWC